jgi:hypothetical protein
MSGGCRAGPPRRSVGGPRGARADDPTLRYLGLRGGGERRRPQWGAGRRLGPVPPHHRWTWEGWIPAARVFGIAAFEGTGKTRLALDLHRRAYLGLNWPDNQPPTLTPGRPALWLCSDGHQDELAELLPAFGLPDEAVVFPAPPDEPYAGTDTLTSATNKDLCAQNTMKALKTPLVRWAQSFGVNVGLNLHLSREGVPLGRRIKGITRTTIHLECPDSEGGTGRLRLWVDKTYSKKPPPLGVTMGDGGNEYDFSPPSKPEPSRGGRPADAREKAQAFIIDALTRDNDQRATELCEEWEEAKGSASAFWRARDVMVKAGELVSEGKPLVLHLNGQAEDGPAESPEVR